MGVSRNLNRKRARGGKLQERHGALFEDCDDEDVVVQKDSKRNKREQECNSEASKGEQELNPNSSKRALNVALKSSRNRHVLKQPNSKSSRICKHGQQLSSKTSKKTQELNSESNKICKKLKSKSGNNDQGLNSDRITQGHKLADVEGKSAKTCKMSIDVKDKKKKKIKKKRDRCGQILDDRGNTQDNSCGGMDGAVLDPVDNRQNAACADVDKGLHTVTEHDSYKGEYNNKTVFVGGIPYDTTDKDILSFFKECGTITRVLCTKFADTQRFKGLAFVTFETETAASKALSLDGANMGSRHIKVEKARAGGKMLRAPPKRNHGDT